MGEVVYGNATDSEAARREGHPGYAYTRRALVPADRAQMCTLGHYELEPGMSAYPYHCHLQNEEIFYILSGQGLLRTPEGERLVGPGESIYFPAGEAGAHKITNISQTEMLVYLDFDVCHPLDACLYPDSGKIGIYGQGVRQIHETANQVDYYKGE